MNEIVNRSDNFTDEALTVLHLAGEEAVKLRHNYIGTEHLLFTVINDERIGQILEKYNISVAKLRQDTEFVIGRGDLFNLGEAGLTPSVKKVIDLAVYSSKQDQAEMVDTIHLFRGLVAEGGGIAAGILGGFGVTRETFPEAKIDLPSSEPVNSLEDVPTAELKAELERRRLVALEKDKQDRIALIKMRLARNNPTQNPYQ